MRYFFQIITCVITILFCSVLFYHNPELANSQIVSGYFALQFIIIISACLAVIGICLSKKRFILIPTDYWMGLVLLLGIIENKLNGNQEIAKLLLLGIGYFTLRLIYSRTTGAVKIASLILLLSGIGECWLGFRQLYGFAASNHAIYKLTGSFFNPGPYSGFLVTVLPISLYWILKIYPEVQDFSFRQIPAILKSAEKVSRYLTFGISAICFCGIIMLIPAGMSRSAWIAGSAGCGIVLARHYNVVSILRNYYLTHRRRIFIYGSVAILLIAGLGVGMYRMKQGSADGRMLMWKVSAMAIEKNPWTGAGAGHFPGIFGQTQAEYFSSGQGTPDEELVAGSPEYGFNEYLQIGVEHGLLGLLILFGIVATALWKASHSREQGTNAALASLVTLLIFALFSYPFRVPSLCMAGIILLTLSVNSSPEQSGSAGKINIWLTRLVALFLPALSLWLIQGRESKQEAYRRWADEKTYFNMNIYEETVDNYRELYPLLNTEPAFMFEYGQCLSKTGKYEDSNRILSEGLQYSGDPMFYNIIGKNHQALKQYDQAESAFRKAAAMVPHRLYPYYLMAKMYFESGQIQAGIETAQTLIGKEPKVMSEAVQDMKKEMREAIENTGDQTGQNNKILNHERL